MGHGLVLDSIGAQGMRVGGKEGLKEEGRTRWVASFWQLMAGQGEGGCGGEVEKVSIGGGGGGAVRAG